MKTVGPQLPPHLVEKRKRGTDDDNNDHDAANSISSPSTSPEHGHLSASPKRARVVGPTLPPAPLDQRPLTAPNDEEAEDTSSDDDDDFGPKLPSKQNSTKSMSDPTYLDTTRTFEQEKSITAAKRDDWMTIAPTSGDWSSRVDPTQLKSRRFNTSKGGRPPAKAVAQDGGGAWHETPAEKQARLQREMLGISENTEQSSGKSRHDDSSKDASRTAKRLQEYTDKSRGPSLYDTHQKGNPQLQEDDPSKRAFDREKDIGGGMKLNSTQKRDMVSKAADFKSKFASAKYL